MSKKSRKKHQKFDLEFDDDFFDGNDNDFDLDQLSRDIYSTEWGSYEERTVSSGKSDSRRRIQHRRDIKKLYSQLDDWEEFGSEGQW
jgi:hypothetical protein